jgi:hypothetical protein
LPYASESLNLYNPQEGENETAQPTVKCFHPIPMAYTAAANPTTPTAPTARPTPSTLLSSLTEDDINQLYKKMKHHVDTTIGQNLVQSTDKLAKKIN